MKEAGLEMSKSTFSHHLRILRGAGLVTEGIQGAGATPGCAGPTSTSASRPARLRPGRRHRRPGCNLTVRPGSLAVIFRPNEDGPCLANVTRGHPGAIAWVGMILLPSAVTPELAEAASNCAPLARARKLAE